MSSDEVAILLTLDDSQAEAEVADLQGKIDRQQQEWAQFRRQTIREMNEIARGMAITVSSIRLVARVAGITIDPIMNALMTLVSSAVSLMIATATAMAASSFGILTGAALILSAAAFGLQAAKTAELIATSEMLKEMLSGVETRLSNLEAGMKFQISGRTG